MMTLIFPVLILSLFYLLLIGRFLAGWQKCPPLQTGEKKDEPADDLFISIVIAARNEEDAILNCLSALALQDFPVLRREIILVDDESQDKTKELAAAFELEGFEILSVETKAEWALGYPPGKKRALLTGIKQAKGRLIITLDADCEPSPKWLSTIAAAYQKTGFAIATGPVLIHRSTGFLEKFQELDVLSLSGITASALALETPVMANGANLAFEKAAFEAVAGYSGSESIATGDDIFLFLKIHQAQPGRSLFLKSRDAVVYAKAQASLSGFCQQRLRWLSKSTRMGKPSILLVLVASWLFIFSIPLVLTAGVIAAKPTFLLGGLWLFFWKTLLDGMFISRVSRFYQTKFNLFFLLPAQLAYLPYAILGGLLANILPYTWKNRTFTK